MKEPQLIDYSAPRIPDEWRRHYLQRPLEKLPEDMNRAFDRVWTLEREKDEINKTLLESRNTLKWQGIWIKLLGLLVVGQFGLIKWLADKLFSMIAK